MAAERYRARLLFIHYDNLDRSFIINLLIKPNNRSNIDTCIILLLLYLLLLYYLIIHFYPTPALHRFSCDILFYYYIIKYRDY